MSNRLFKVGCVFPMVFWPEFCMRHLRDVDHREDAPHFKNQSYGGDTEKTLTCTLKAAVSFVDN